MPTEFKFTRHRPSSTTAAVGIIGVCALLVSFQSSAQAVSAGTASIERGSDAEKALKIKGRSFKTREERLRAKPLDWNVTIGKRSRRHIAKADAQAEEQALLKAPPETSESGLPDPNAEKEARKNHPQDWE